MKYNRVVSVGKKAQEELAHALSLISEAVGSTLGPGGRPFGFDKLGTDMRLSASFTKDGLTVLKSLDFDNPSYQAVLQYCRQASSNSVLESGDGPQPLHSKVLTPKGFIEMRDVRIGMEVCGVNNTIQVVLGVFPKGEKEIYEVEFSNKGVVECCSDHLWTVINTSLYNPKEQTKTTSEISKDYPFRDKNGNLRSKYYTPRTKVNFYTNEAEMPLDPYLVGVLLGDGSLSGTGSIEVALGIKKEHILNKIKVPEGIWLNTKFIENKNYFRVKLNGHSNGRSMSDIIKSLGLLGVKSGTKFIPKSYLYSSIENRKSLLQGLIDTDGYINGKGLFEFSTIGEEMCKDFTELCRSLGMLVKVTKHERKENDGSYSDRSIYRIVELKGYKYGDKIVKITPTGKFTQMQCIKVSNPDNLYITDNYITTHNTTSTIVLADAVCRGVLAAESKSPQAMARQIEEEAENAISEIRKTAIKTDDAVRKVAITSTNGDEELANIVLESIKYTGAYGTIIATKNAASKARYKIVRQDGYSNCGGYNYNQTLALSASDNAASSKPIEWNDPKVLIFNGNLITEQQINGFLSLWSASIKKNGPSKLVILCYEISDEVANKLLVVNRTLAKDDNAVFVVKPRLTAETNAGIQILRDVAAFTGIEDSKIIDGGNYKNLDESFFGTCKSVRIGVMSSAFLGRAPNHWVVKRVDQNNSIIEEARSEFDSQITSIRNAELAEGLVKVEIGGGLLPDLQERADRFDDASKAAQTTMREGALPGGGISYIRAGYLAKVNPVLLEAFGSIFEKVVSNYGESLKLVFDLDKNLGFKLTKSKVEFGDPVELGVLDAVETVCSVIRNGVSLGVKIAILGGYSYRDQKSNVEEIE